MNLTDEKKELVFNITITGIIFCLFMSLVVFIFVSCEKDSQEISKESSKIKISTKEYKLPIYSLESQESISGNMNGFVIGFFPITYGNSDGNISSSINYYVYLKQANGYILKSYPSDTTKLIETDKVKPGLLEIYKIVNIPGTLKYLDLPQEYFDMISQDKFDNSRIKNGFREVWLLQNQSLIVPINTIKKQFNASLQK
jgi:hypothetical protein